ncbi:MAG TPA: HAD family hydrolase [Candidatus Nanopelagicales bacterium]
MSSPAPVRHRAPAPVEAVIFDWGGTLTPWHDVDLTAAWYAYSSIYDPRRAASLAAELFAAEIERWQAQHASAGVAGAGRLEQVLLDCGIDLHSGRHHAALAAYLEFWDPHTHADPDAVPLLRALRERGIRVGVLSNTLWPRTHHEAVFERDGLLALIDGAVYSSELPVGKPHQDAFQAAMAAVGVTDPARVVFVGDRAWDDVHGAQQAGMRAILVPHSSIPAEQRGPVEGTPDAVVGRLGEVLHHVDAWNAAAG